MPATETENQKTASKQGPADRLTALFKSMQGAFTLAEPPLVDVRPKMKDNPVYKIICDAGLTQTQKADAVRAHVRTSPRGERDFNALLVDLADVRINLDGENLRQPGALELMSQSMQLRADMMREFKDKDPDAIYATAGELLAKTDEIITRYDTAGKEGAVLIGKYEHLAGIYAVLGAATSDDPALIQEKSLSLTQQIASMKKMAEDDLEQAVNLQGVRMSLALMQQKWNEKQRCKAFTENLAQTGMSTQRKVTVAKRPRFKARQPAG